MFDFSFTLVRLDDKPLYTQIYDHISGAIVSGRLAYGEKLPSNRRLCENLGISMSTVETAYSVLLAEGYIESRPKRGYYVCSVVPVAPAASVESPRHAGAGAGEQYRWQFSTSGVDTDVFPYSTWARLMKETIYNGRELLSRGDSFGDMELREAISAFLYQYRGARADAGQLVIGSGIQSLLDRLFFLLSPETVYAFEEPTYLSAYRSLREKGASIVSVPLDEGGISMQVLRDSGADVVYVTPSHQFPTGVTMPIGRRHELLGWAGEKPGRYVIEDDYDSEFRYSLRPIPCMQGLSDSGRVIYLGTFSRTIAPSFRIAYMLLPDSLMEKYSARYSYSTCTVSRFEQQALSRFISGGQYARHLRRAALLYRDRIALLRREIAKMPGARVLGAQAGLHFMLNIPSLGEDELVRRARICGVRLHGLSEYYVGPGCPPSTLVLGFAGLDDAKIVSACGQLRRAWFDS